MQIAIECLSISRLVVDVSIVVRFALRNIKTLGTYRIAGIIVVLGIHYRVRTYHNLYYNADN